MPAGDGPPVPRPSAYAMTAPCEKPPTIVRGQSRSSASSARSDAANVVGSGSAALLVERVPVRQAVRVVVRRAERDAVQAAVGVELGEQRLEAALVAGAAVEEDERALRRRRAPGARAGSAGARHGRDPVARRQRGERALQARAQVLEPRRQLERGR